MTTRGRENGSYVISFRWDLQNVANDADGPHVGAESDPIEVDHFRSDEFGRAEENFQLFRRIETSSQTEIDDFDPMTITIDAQDIFRLEECALESRGAERERESNVTFMSR